MFHEAYQGRRVLVTGHTGFKGAWLSHWLLRLGARVSGLALRPDTSPNLFETLGLNERMADHRVDVRDYDRLRACVEAEAPEIIFHLAAQPLVRLSYQEPRATFETNVGGVVNLLDIIRGVSSLRACVVVTTDKCYENREQIWGYRETDAMGGHDPYSASKGAAEIVVSSFRRSFFHKPSAPRVASARAGNVIGGGDWSADRIVPDLVRALERERPLVLRSPHAVRPWQHVLEPLSGYLALGAALLEPKSERFAEAFNFGPAEESHETVGALAEQLVRCWGRGEVQSAPVADGLHEATLLKLDCSKARVRLGWRSVWNFHKTVAATVAWYRGFAAGEDMRQLTDDQLDQYQNDARQEQLPWSRSGRRTMAAA